MFSWEKFAHRVVTEKISFKPNMLHRPKEVDDFLAVGKKIVQEKGVNHEHGEEEAPTD